MLLFLIKKIPTHNMIHWQNFQLRQLEFVKEAAELADMLVKRP